MWILRSTFLILILTDLLLISVEVFAQPSWYQNPEREYPRRQYLTGLGMGTGEDKAERMQVAEENARSDLIKSIRTQISSEFIDETTETSRRMDVYVQSRVVSNASLEVDGIQIVQRRHEGNTAYALAVLPKLEGRQRHAGKMAHLDQEISRGFKEAKQFEVAGQTEEALKAYLPLFPLLTRHEETQAVLLALGDFSTAAFQELDELEEQGIISRTDVDAAIERLTAKDFGTVDAAAAALAFRLGRQLNPGQCVLVLPFTYAGTRFTSPFSRYLAQVVSQKLADAALRPVQPVRKFQPKTMDYQRELARQAGAEVVIRGPYVRKGRLLKVFALASEIQNGRKVGAADVEIERVLLEQEHLNFLPQNYQRALQDAGVFGTDELVLGNLQVEAWTDRGAENVILEEDEEVTLGVRVNQPCYLQLVYHLANGKRALLYNNHFINEAKVNHAVMLPDTFVVAEPFGVEVVQVFASTERFPEVRVRDWEGYDVLEEDLEEYVSRTRGLKRRERTQEVAETRVTITTMAKR